MAPIPSWDHWPKAATQVFQGFRSEAGEAMVLKHNALVEQVLPVSVIRKMTSEEMELYRRPFGDAGESRRPTLTWPRQIPIEGSPQDVHELVLAYSEWLAGSSIPKLFVNAEPGAILRGSLREFCRTWPNQIELTVPGIHFIQEDSPELIGYAVADWYRSMAQRLGKAMRGCGRSRHSARSLAIGQTWECRGTCGCTASHWKNDGLLNHRQCPLQTLVVAPGFKSNG